jgi:phage terminase large subunit-like protein
MGKSIMEQLALLPEEERLAILDGMDPESLVWDWSVWARPEQTAPEGDWNVWLVLAGRGFGKTRLASEWVREQAKVTKDGQRRFALVARTAADVRDVIVEGESGIINVSPPSEKPHYEPSKRRLTWPNGNTATLFTADEPDGLRGPQFRLDIGTLVPTPSGWTTMGELKTGDYVFDEQGTPTKVTKAHDIELALDSYRITFSDGTYIDADSKHLWLTLTKTDLRYVSTHYGGVIPCTWSVENFGRESHNAEIKSTEDLLNTMNMGHYIPATRPIEYAALEQELPIDPWVLGILLGDAASGQPNYIATHEKDKNWLISELNNSGVLARDFNRDHVMAKGLAAGWNRLNLLKNKHIPDIYLRASVQERFELIRGLIDSDGGVERSGAYRFYNTNKTLIDAFVELTRSVGLVPKTYYRKPRLRKGNLGKPSWYVQVYSTTPLAKNPDKLAKAKHSWSYAQVGRYIKSIKPITPTLMRCITVDSPSHLYLASNSMIATHNTHAWGDEIAAWRQTPDAAGMTAFDNLRVGTRLGRNPQIICTTTPKRVPLLYKLIEESRTDNPNGAKVVVTKGSTLDNAGNLSQAYLDTIMGVYEGTTLARQELYGEMLDDVEGALWNEEMVESARHVAYPPVTPLRIIGVDPSVAENPRDECGIVVCASTAEPDLFKRNAWVLEDATIHGSPDTWARKVVEMARKWGCPVVAEVNQGGALVRNAINSIDPTIKVLEVHSKHGKALRAEPTVLAYEQQRVHHVGYLQDLESQMYSWIPGEGKSPDRVDALVHALTALLIKPPPGFSGGKIRAKSFADRKLGVTNPNSRPAGRIFRVR